MPEPTTPTRPPTNFLSFDTVMDSTVASRSDNTPANPCNDKMISLVECVRNIETNETEKTDIWITTVRR